jgi:hypothetical protein
MTRSGSSRSTRADATARSAGPGEATPGCELPAPAGLAFYVPPAPLPGRPAGQRIWARRLTGAAVRMPAAMTRAARRLPTHQPGRSVRAASTRPTMVIAMAYMLITMR